jgi:hypothetical protein
MKTRETSLRLSVLHSISMLLLVTLPSVVQAQFTYETNNGTITITGYTGTGGEVSIPESITGLPVTSIRGYAFHDNGFLRKVTISDSVTSIGERAFQGCGGLTNAIISNDLTSIGDWAFAACDLTNVTIPDSVTSIGNGAFFACRLTKVTIPNKVTYIGMWAFQYCTSLTTATIPNSVEGIPNYSFQYCTSLTSVTIPNGAWWIGGEAFSGCTSLTSVTIPKSISLMGHWAFQACTNLTAIYFQGDAPDAYEPFRNASPTVYYLPGTTGWDTTFEDQPTAVWVLPNPLILNKGLTFGVQTNGFGFLISWATNVTVVVEASTRLTNPIWVPAATNTLAGG